MGTTTGIDTGRRGDACGDGIDEFLSRAQETFATLSRNCELQLDALFSAEKTDKERTELIRALITTTQQAYLKVLDIEAKIALQNKARAAQVLDLEEARAEIERRLARLAA